MCALAQHACRRGHSALYLRVPHLGDQTIADAMLDRLMENHHRFTLTGESLRKKGPPAKRDTAS